MPAIEMAPDVGAAPTSLGSEPSAHAAMLIWNENGRPTWNCTKTCEVKARRADTATPWTREPVAGLRRVPPVNGGDHDIAGKWRDGWVLPPLTAD